METSKLVLTLIIITIVSFSVALFIQGSCGNQEEYSEKKSNTIVIDEKKEITFEPGKNISIEVSSSDITISHIDGNIIKAHLHGTLKSFPKPAGLNLECLAKNSEITISVKSNYKGNRMYFFETNNTKLEIAVPRSFRNNLKIKTSSGDISADLLQGNNIDIEVSSGDLEVKKIIGNFSSRASSGDMVIGTIKSTSTSMEASSGKIEVNEINADKIDFDTSSGDIEVKKITGNLKSETSSGTMQLSFFKIPKNISTRSSSGDITLKLPKNAFFKIDAQSNSGTIKCDFPVTLMKQTKRKELVGYVGQAGNLIEIETSSGDITLRK